LSESLGKPTSGAHLAFFIARALGADPIIFIGLDLSFPSDGSHHAEGAADVWTPRPDEEYVHVADVFGGYVKTLPGFQSMIGLFEAEVAKTDALCIDATEGGALIRGTKTMPLTEALTNYVLGKQTDNTYGEQTCTEWKIHQ
jgi:hypothetical protein